MLAIIPATRGYYTESEFDWAHSAGQASVAVAPAVLQVAACVFAEVPELVARFRARAADDAGGGTRAGLIVA